MHYNPLHLSCIAHSQVLNIPLSLFDIENSSTEQAEGLFSLSFRSKASSRSEAFIYQNGVCAWNICLFRIISCFLSMFYLYSLRKNFSSTSSKIVSLFSLCFIWQVFSIGTLGGFPIILNESWPFNSEHSVVFDEAELFKIELLAFLHFTIVDL
jgi:hypothetical protein